MLKFEEPVSPPLHQFIDSLIKNRFVFLALMEYACVNVLLGDTAAEAVAAREAAATKEKHNKTKARNENSRPDSRNELGRETGNNNSQQEGERFRFLSCSSNASNTIMGSINKSFNHSFNRRYGQYVAESPHNFHGDIFSYFFQLKASSFYIFTIWFSVGIYSGN